MINPMESEYFHVGVSRGCSFSPSDLSKCIDLYSRDITLLVYIFFYELFECNLSENDVVLTHNWKNKTKETKNKTKQKQKSLSVYLNRPRIPLNSS